MLHESSPINRYLIENDCKISKKSRLLELMKASSSTGGGKSSKKEKKSLSEVMNDKSGELVSSEEDLVVIRIEMVPQLLRLSTKTDGSPVIEFNDLNSKKSETSILGDIEGDVPNQLLIGDAEISKSSNGIVSNFSEDCGNHDSVVIVDDAKGGGVDIDDNIRLFSSRSNVCDIYLDANTNNNGDTGCDVHQDAYGDTNRDTCIDTHRDPNVDGEESVPTTLHLYAVVSGSKDEGVQKNVSRCPSCVQHLAGTLKMGGRLDKP